ncbi:MAG: GvpL/GvpF family gas vesicle protein [Chloroflexi bacterium]|nr:GvpL/GvpF family gas vesicle protein [Chloroflexota bacterium]
MSAERKYLYGIIKESIPRTFNLSGVGGAGVYTIGYQEVAAVVSDTGLGEIDPTRQNVRAHTEVQDGLLKAYTLLPMGFGMIADSKDDVCKLLAKNYQGLISELKRLDGKVEVELKVFWDQGALSKELEGGSDELTRLKSRIKNASSPAETRELLIEVGKLVERIAFNWKARYADRVYAVLKGLACDARLNNPLGIKNVLNASFLIEKAKESDFQKEVYKLDAQYQSKVNFKYVGPLAPYNFVSLKLELVA